MGGDAERLADRVGQRDRYAAKHRGHMVLHAEVIEPVGDLRGDDLEVVDAVAEEERPQNVEIFAHCPQRPARFAVANHAVVGRNLDQGEAAPEVQPARHAIGLVPAA